jgi:biotin synthase
MNLVEILHKEDLTREEIVFLLSLNSKEEVLKLYRRADKVRKKYCGDDVHLRGIIEFSNYCEQDCLYCGLQISNDLLPRYRMTREEILKTVNYIVKADIKTIVLQSGEDFFFTKEFISDVIKSIKEKYDVAITLSLGERSFEEYSEWRNAGADRYLLKHETANKRLYSAIHNKQNLDDRIKHLEFLKSIGFQAGSGNIIGLPGQTIEDISDDILLCKSLISDMASFSPFIPSHDTPFRKVSKADLELTLKTMAVARIVLKDTHIPSTTALGSLVENGREKGLEVGANVVMPNYTPLPYRKDYKIYEGKICITDDPLACAGCLQLMIEGLGRRVDVGKGDSLKPAAKK